MKKACLGLLLLAVSALFTAAGCGGGGSAAPPTSAVVKLYIDGTSGNQFGGVDVTLHLPTGVSVKTTQDSQETDAGVVAASGEAETGSIATGNYSPGDQTLRVVLAQGDINNPEGFDVGEFATVNCDIASGYKPTASEFSVSDLTVWDIGSASDVTKATGVQPNLIVSFK